MMNMSLRNNNTKGGTAQKKNSSTENKKKKLRKNFTLTYVIYLDHVEYRNCNSKTIRPVVRESVGWISSEDDNAICICSDRSPKLFKDIQNKESGFLILKNNILELVEIDFDNCFICNRECILGNIYP